MRDIERAWSPRFGVWMWGMRKEFGMTPKCGKNMEGDRGGISESIAEMTGRVSRPSQAVFEEHVD